MSGYHCKHCGKIVMAGQDCGCDGEKQEHKSMIDSIKMPPPVDRSNRCTTDGQHKNYVILCSRL